MARMEAKLMFKYAKWTVFEKGSVIYEAGKDTPNLNFIVEVRPVQHAFAELRRVGPVSTLSNAEII